jgi:HD-like signal output (HDOD) protein
MPDGKSGMKKRILFVDDEALVLQGLQRMLRSMREEWEMEFVESGAKALERMALSPFDVVVSDMRMPGMNGADLLGQVMQLYPKTVRLILSGHADKELIFKCVGSAHQFLSKPCDSEALKATVRGASGNNDALQNDALKRLVAQMSRLPGIPSLYSDIMKALRDPEVSLEIVGGIIAKDIAMTAQILKLVNSAFFGLRRQVSSPGEAVNYLGLDTIRSLVLSINVFSQYESTKIDRFSYGALWTHCLDAGAAAKAIAQLENADRNCADESFVAGLLHDAGKLVLAANYADQYATMLQLMQREGLEQGQAEAHIFGANHADVGGYLFGLWGLPVRVVEAIALHHRPGCALEKTFSPLTAVHVANGFVHYPGDAPMPMAEGRLDAAYLKALGLETRVTAWREDFLRTHNSKTA